MKMKILLTQTSIFMILLGETDHAFMWLKEIESDPLKLNCAEYIHTGLFKELLFSDILQYSTVILCSTMK